MLCRAWEQSYIPCFTTDRSTAGKSTFADADADATTIAIADTSAVTESSSSVSHAGKGYLLTIDAPSGSKRGSSYAI